MRFLVDENMPATSVIRLRERGHDIESVRDLSPGIDDGRVIERASADRRIILTFGKDFGEWIFLRRHSVPGVILFRKTRPVPRAELADWIVQIVLSRNDWEGKFSTVTDLSRIRVRIMNQSS